MGKVTSYVFNDSGVHQLELSVSVTQGLPP